MEADGMMTDWEAVNAVRSGGRAKTDDTRHDAETRSAGCEHRWRCVACYKSEWDVEECYHCGKQRVVPCSFDDEYA